MVFLVGENMFFDMFWANNGELLLAVWIIFFIFAQFFTLHDKYAGGLINLSLYIKY